MQHVDKKHNDKLCKIVFVLFYPYIIGAPNSTPLHCFIVIAEIMWKVINLVYRRIKKMHDDEGGFSS